MCRVIFKSAHVVVCSCSSLLQLVATMKSILSYFSGSSLTSRTASSIQGSVPSSSNSIVMLSSEAGKETECIQIDGSQVSKKRKLDTGAGVHDNDSRAIEQCDGNAYIQGHN